MFAIGPCVCEARAAAGWRRECMRAIVQREYGSPDVLRVEDIAAPIPTDDEVVVAVRAAAVNVGDWHLVRGVPYVMRLVTGLSKPRQSVPGLDVAGRVEAVGRNVTKFQPGDEVFGWCKGAFAEQACARESNFLPKPASLTFEQAAAVGDSALTALNAVRDQGKVGPGQRVLINGASGGVGTFAVQIAKSSGAHVTAVCSTRNIELVRSLGADEVIDYTQEDFVARDRPRYDVMLDLVGNRPLSNCRRVLTRRGTYVLVGVADMGRWFGLSRQIKMLAISPFVREKLRVFITKHNSKDLAALKQLVEAGEVNPVIDRRFELDEAPQALRHQGEGHPRGKTVIAL